MRQPEGGNPSEQRATGSRGWYWLFALPMIGLLWVPFYAKQTPELLGFPFFYWYQIAWVPISVLLTVIVYLKTRPPGGER